jgi:hypothetical protein
MTSSVAMCDVRAHLNGQQWLTCGGFFAVDGTAYPGAPFPPSPILNDGSGFWSGFSSGMVGGMTNVQDGLWDSFCLGYGAATIPMWPSVQKARGNISTPGTLVYMIHAYAQSFFAARGYYPPITGSGYSQGSMIWDQVWVLDILSPTGDLHYLLNYVYRIYQYGHIFRCPAIAHGNALAGLSESIITNGQQSGGIGCVLDLTEAQTNYVAPDGNPVIYSCANPGDLYTACPTGLNPWTNLASQGKTGQLFFKIVMQPTFVDVVEAALVLEHPIASIEEGLNAGTFFAEGVNAPHYQYFPQMTACINDVIELGNKLPHESGYAA